MRKRIVKTDNIKDFLERNNIKGFYLDKTTKKRHYIKNCYTCGSEFHSARVSALTCCNTCKMALNRRFKAGKKPIFKFSYKQTQYETLAGVKRKQ